MTLPTSLAPYTDTYFLRSRTILQKEHLNPYVRSQIFIRLGPGRIYGITEVLSVIRKFLPKRVTVRSLREGDRYSPEETGMILEGRAQDILLLETVILGIISAETTKANDNVTPNPEDVTKTVRTIAHAADGRPVVYFGARHWRYDKDAELSAAAFAGGVADASTDIGAATNGKKGVGTIPHALQCIFAWRYGIENAVSASIKAFDRHMDKSIPRIALVDFANKEIDDSVKATREVGEALDGIRVDTCGENSMQGITVFDMHKNEAYWHGRGVTIAGVYRLRKALTDEGFPHIKIMLSGGFGDIHKVTAFVQAEKELGIRLFDSLGIGQVFPVRAATMDVVAVGDTPSTLRPIAKVGRHEKPNPRLRKLTP